MATKLTRQHAELQEPWETCVKNTSIADQALQAWSRIPSNTKVEILKAVEQPCTVRDASVKTVKVGEQTLMVKKMSSGFRVLYEPGIDSNTIVSVLTPREVGLLKG